MITIYKAPIRHSFGWTDPRGSFGDLPRDKKFAHKRLIEDTDTGELNEYTNAYIHGASDKRTSLQSHEALQS
jgi:hypothetical protein